MAVERIYTYRATPKPGMSQAGIVKAMTEMGGLLSKHNKFVKEVTVQLAGPDIEIRLAMLGHDQWWIKKRVVYPIAALLAKAGMKVDQATLISVDMPEDRRKTRIRSADGHHNLPAPDVMVDHGLPT